MAGYLAGLRRSSRAARGTLAPALCLLLLLVACATTPLPLPPPRAITPTVTTGADALAGAAIAIRMFDAADGWAISSGHLLRTTDGATHWGDVTPMPVPAGATADLAWAEPLSAGESWAARQVGNDAPQAPQALLYHTTDGGRTWRSTPLAAFDIAQVSFVDVRHGWMLADVDSAEGMQLADILRTTDGGASWSKVSTTGDAAGQLPVAGHKTGLTFLDADTGWVTTTGQLGGPVGDASWLYVTHDGGASWQPVALPAPVSPAPPQPFIDDSYPPVFFSPREGVLVAGSAAGVPAYSAAYVTHDGGATWSPVAPLPIDASEVSVADAAHWWVASYSDSGERLFATGDAGQQWTELHPGAPFDQSGALSFVSPALGWATSAAGLLRTRDGGRSWTVVVAAPPPAG